MHIYVELAFKAIREYISNKKMLVPPDPLPDDMKGRSGVFVCLKIQDALRGCIGTIEPARENLAQEIIENAVCASWRDSRFSPLSVEELENIDVTVDILSAPEPVKDISKLDPGVYGVIVTSGLKRGLLLPDIKGVTSVEQQISICRRKGNIEVDEEISIQRFTVTRYR